MSPEECASAIVAGEFRRIVALTGAGISEPAGIPDFRGKGGLFARLREAFPDNAEVQRDPSCAMSRSWINADPARWGVVRSLMPDDARPTACHRLLESLAARGALTRIYTQNIDNLHNGVPRDLVVHCHGTLDDPVLYGDPLPGSFEQMCHADFFSDTPPDLIVVMGTSLQVSPVCAIPNMMPRKAHRLLVNPRPYECFVNDWSKGALPENGFATTSYIKIRKRRVTLRPDWESSRWRDTIAAMTCDDFAHMCGVL